MDPINGLSALYEILRRQVTAKAQPAGRTARSAGESATRAPTARGELIELERQLRAGLKEQTRDALFSPASKRWVIASLLSWELEPAMQNEPKFNALVASVQRSIDADARLKVKFEGVLEQLCR
jgi:hypothetical protein